MIKYSLKIKDWPEEERPRERLIKWGADKLTDAELLAILLRAGYGKVTAIDLARQMLHKFGGFRGLDAKSVTELCKVNGIGPAKAANIKAALELGKRFFTASYREMKKIDSAKDVFLLLGPYLRDLERELFKILLLTARNNLISEKTIFEGSLTEIHVNPREIIKEALNENAASIVLVHNHPSGIPQPSEEDRRITRQIVDACKLVGINVLDHIIIGKNSFYSFVESGKL